MNREQKKEFVEQFAQKVASAKLALVTNFIGLNVGQINSLRGDLRKSDCEMKVVKNTLIRLAAKGTPLEQLDSLFEGPNALVLGYEDPVVSAKILTKFAEKHPQLVLKGGVLEGKTISSEEIVALSKLPGREVLLSQLLGLLKAPQRNMVSLMSAVPRKLLYALQAKAEQSA